ncbi:MAG: glycoside hydrolase family protein, partial [Acidimicrobiaceae bacterium]
LKRVGQNITSFRSNDLRIGDGTLDPLVNANWNTVRSQAYGATQTDGTSPNQTAYAVQALPAEIYVGFANSEHNSKGPALQRVVYRILPSSYVGGDVGNKITTWDTPDQLVGTDATGKSDTVFGTATIGTTITWTTTVGAVNEGLAYTISSASNNTSYLDFLPPRRLDFQFVSVAGPTGSSFASPPSPPSTFHYGALVSGSTSGMPVSPQLYEPLNDTGVINFPLDPVSGAVGDFAHAHDVGWVLNPSVPGSASAADGVYTLSGGGTDIWDDADHFQFAYKEVTGDFVATARVVDITGAATALGRWGRGGIMARYTCDPASKYSLACVPFRGEADATVANDSRRHQSRRSHLPSFGVVNGRDTAGTFNRDQQVVPLVPAELDQGFRGWVRLTRQGNYFYSQFALDVDGQPGTWVLAGGDHHPAPPDKILLGLIAGAHSTYGFFSPAGDNAVTVKYDSWSVRAVADAPSVCEEIDVAFQDDFESGVFDVVTSLVVVGAAGTPAYTPAHNAGRVRLLQNGTTGNTVATWFNVDGWGLGDSGFKADFDVFYTKESGNDPADGMTFAVVEGTFDTAAGLVGDGGGAMGYNRSDPNAIPALRRRSFAVEMDVWDGGHGDSDPPGQGANGSNQDNRYHMGIDFNFEVQSAVNNVEYGQMLPALYKSVDGMHVEVLYNPADSAGTGASTISVYGDRK